jgi:hypothetical protein
MSAVIRMTLLCDECYSYETEEVYTDDVDEAREKAEAYGWVLASEDRDLCPSCASAEEVA